MKGFYITVYNGLLEPKHRKGIGEAIWLFLWYLDKMTIVNEEIGEGKVLGGKPIKYEEVNKDLDISRATYKRWVIMLRKGKYISTKRTPYGLITIVYKAKKVFNQRVVKNEPSNKSSMSHLRYGNEPSNKTRQYDKTSNQRFSSKGERDLTKLSSSELARLVQ